MNKKLILSIAFYATVSVAVKAQTTTTMTTQQLHLHQGTTTINYVQQGHDGLTLLFLHGWCINSGYWERQFAHFGEKHTLYAMDLPAFGASTAQREDWTIAAYAQDVLDFIDALALEEVVLIGHSMSGDIMLEAAVRAPDKIRALVGVDNFKMVDAEYTPEQMDQFQRFMGMLKTDFQQAVRGYSEQMLFLPTSPQEAKDRVMADIRATPPSIGYNTLANLMLYMPDEVKKLHRSKHKLYLINSDAVPTHRAGLEKYCAQGYELREILATGHYPMIEKPEAFNALLEETLSAIRSEKGQGHPKVH